MKKHTHKYIENTGIRY